MSEKPEYIQLEPNEDVPSVRDRLSFIRGRRVMLIWPEEGTALTRKLDLVLVQREAKRRVIQLALVTHDEQVIQHAQELSISTFETIQASENARWKRGRTRNFLPRHHKPSHEPEPEELMPVASRVRRPRKRISQVRYVLTRVLVLGLVLGTITASAYYFLPAAEIVLTLEEETINVSTSITVDSNANDIDIDNGIIPATRLRATVQTVGTIPTSGIQQLDDTAAIGLVTFTNQTTQSIEIPRGTIVSTSAGTPIQYRTITGETLPGGIGERVEAAIEALPESAGSVGNVEAGMINSVLGVLEGQVSVRNLTATTGGESRNQPIVTNDDLERLLGIVRGQLQAQAYSEMQTTLSPSQLIVLETVRIAEERTDWTNFSHGLGAITNTLTLDMRAIVQAIAIDDRFAQQVVFARLSAEKPPGLILQPDSFTYVRGSVTAREQVMLEASGSAQAVAQIDTARLAEVLAGLPVEEVEGAVRAYVQLAPDTQPRIQLSPAWLNHLPLLPLRLTITTQGQSS